MSGERGARRVARRRPFIKLSFFGLIVVLAAALSTAAFLADPTVDNFSLAWLNFLSVAVPLAIVGVFVKDTNYSMMFYISIFFLMTGPGRQLYFVNLDQRYIDEWYFVGINVGEMVWPALWSFLFNSALGLSVALTSAVWGRPRQVVFANLRPPGDVEFFFKITLLLVAFMGSYGLLESTGGFRFFESSKTSTIVEGTKLVYSEYQFLTSPAIGVMVMSLYRIITRTAGRFERTIFLIALLYCVWWGYVRSVRGDIFQCVLLVVFIYLIVKRSVPILWGTVLTIPLLGLAASVIAQRRNDGDLDLGSLMRGAIESVFGEFNLGGFIPLLHMLRTVPDKLDFQYGQTFLQLFWLPIPRVLWPDKPQAVGAFLGAVLTPSATARAGGGVATGLIGEAYLNFSYVGLIVVPMVFGLLVVAVDRYLARHRADVVGVTMGVLMGSMLAYNTYGYYAANGVIQMAVTLLPFIALKALTGTPSPGAQQGKAVAAR